MIHRCRARSSSGHPPQGPIKPDIRGLLRGPDISANTTATVTVIVHPAERPMSCLAKAATAQAATPSANVPSQVRVHVEIPPAAPVRAAPDALSLSRAVSIRGWSRPSVSEANRATAASSSCLFSARCSYNSLRFTRSRVARTRNLRSHQRNHVWSPSADSRSTYPCACKAGAALFCRCPRVGPARRSVPMCRCADARELAWAAAMSLALRQTLL